MALALGREVPCESYSWERSSSQWLLLLGEKFLVNLTLRKGVPPSGSCSWERSSLSILLLAEEFLPVALPLGRVALLLEVKPSVALTLRREIFRGPCSWERDSQRIVLRRAVLGLSCSCGLALVRKVPIL